MNDIDILENILWMLALILTVAAVLMLLNERKP